MGKPADQVQGTLDLLVLRTVALQPMHGWGIAQRIRQASREVSQVNQGALYLALHGLEQQGWIRAKWGESDNHRRAKFYSLTPDGANYLLKRSRLDQRLENRSSAASRSSKLPNPERSLAVMAIVMSIPMFVHSDGASKQSLGDRADELTVPFYLVGGFLVVVEGQIGLPAPIRFALDSGTTHSMLDSGVAKKLGLKLESGIVLNFDRQIDIAWATLPSLTMGPLHAASLRVMVGEIKQISDFGGEIDGILGLDFLRMAQSWRIDFRARTVTLAMRGDKAPAGEVMQALVVPLTVGKHDLHVVVDTGACDLMLYEQRLLVDLPAENLREVRPARVGYLKGKVAHIDGMRLGGDELGGAAFLIPGEAPSSDFDGYVGICAFNAKVLQLDFGRSVLTIVEREGLSKRRPPASWTERTQIVLH